MNVRTKALSRAVVAGGVIGVPLMFTSVAPALNRLNEGGRLGLWLVRLVPASALILGLMVLVFRSRRSLTFEPATRNRWHWGYDLVVPATACLLLVALSFWPISNWATQLYGGTGDNFNWRWQIWRFGQELRQGSLVPTTFDDVVAPYGVDLRLNDGYLGMYIGGMWNLLLRPTLAYNVTVASAMVLSFWASRRLSLFISPNRMLALLAGIASATAPVFTIRYYGHLNLSFAFVLFLVAQQCLMLLRPQSPRVWRLALVVVLAFLSSFYVFVITAIVVAIAALVRLSQCPNRAEVVRTGLRLVAIGGIVMAAISPFLVARLQHESKEAQAGAPAASARTEEYMYYSVDPRLFYVPAHDSPANPPAVVDLRQSLSPNQVESTPFPGYVFIGAVGAIVFVASRWKWLIALLWSIFTLLPMGPTLIWGADPNVVPFFPKAIVNTLENGATSWLPYQFFTFVPGLSALRAPNRFAMALPVVGVIALAMVWRSRTVRHRTLPGGVLIPVALAILIVPNIRTERPWYPSEYSKTITTALETIRADQSNRTVAVGGDNCLRNTNTVNTQIIHRHPMVGCQTFSAAIPWYSGIQEYKSNLGLASIQCESRVFGLSSTEFIESIPPDATTLSELATGLNVGWILIDKNHMCDDNPARREQLLSALDEHATKMAEDNRYLIFSIN